MYRLQRAVALAGLAILVVGVAGCSGMQAEGAAGSESDSLTSIEVVAERPVEVVPLRDRALISRNLLKNGEFTEHDGKTPEAWQASDEASVGIASGGVDGLGALAITASEGGAVVTQQIEVRRGEQYWLRGHVRTENLEGAASVVVQAPGYPGVLHEASPAYRGDTWWTPVSLEFTSPLDRVEVRLELASAGNSGGRAFFDAIEVYRLDVPPSVNLLLNGSFESARDYAEHWRKTENFNVERSSEAIDGSSSLHVTVAAEDDFDVYQAVTVTPGGAYELSGMIKTEDLEGDVQLEVRDLRRGFRGFIHSGEPLTGTNDWTYLSTTFTLPEHTDLLAVFLRRPLTGSAGSGAIWFDSYRLIPVRNH